MIEHYTFNHNFELNLESGKSLAGFQLRYSTMGSLNENKDNVVWVIHALTGSSDFLAWWQGLFGEGKIYDPQKYFIICVNTLGGCYGSTGPLSINPATKRPYYHSFPQLSIRDIVASFELLRQSLSIKKIHTVIGGSMGGQEALEWCISKPEVFQHLVQIASNAKHSAWGIAFNESQRAAIAQDITWQLHTDDAGREGMKVARSIALLSYRHYSTYQSTQSEVDDEVCDNYKAARYQKYQGEKLAQRFNAYTYWILSKAMDSHNIGRGRGGVEKAIQQLQAKCLFVGINSDILFPVSEQQYLAGLLNDSHLKILESNYGHDGFLIEYAQLTKTLQEFYQSVSLVEQSVQ
ncbi:MAG: homoserine O-acetyltransferase [Bacteroidota bacterium]|nr:homoserine O-acetyltransferase [Bacteroidota bacterium]